MPQLKAKSGKVQVHTFFVRIFQKRNRREKAVLYSLHCTISPDYFWSSIPPCPSDFLASEFHQLHLKNFLA
jgi:hypothetical protein